MKTKAAPNGMCCSALPEYECWFHLVFNLFAMYVAMLRMLRCTSGSAVAAVDDASDDHNRAAAKACSKRTQKQTTLEKKSRIKTAVSSFSIDLIKARRNHELDAASKA